ncbi:hypothetical protein ES703_21201 [subsurface metagenome]
MWFLLAIILVVLGLLVFALRGVLGIFPDSWEWAGIVLAGVGIAMGVPSVLQMAMGRPKLMINFDRTAKGEERFLAVFLKNPQLEKKSVWRKLGIKRDTIESLIVSFRISEVGTGKIILPIMQSRIYSDDDTTDVGKNRIALPPTLSFEASVMIAIWDKDKKRAIIPGDRLRPSVEISAGVYQITIIFVVDGEPQTKFRQFIVGNTADELDWIVPKQSKTGKVGSLS